MSNISYQSILDKIDQLITDIYECRKIGMANNGESDINNLVFKEFRNRGYLDRLKKLKNALISKKLSLEEGINYLDNDHEFKDYGTAEVEDKNVIDTHKASTFATQDLLDGSTDSAYDDVCYTIIDLTPTQYFELCGKVQDMSPEEIIRFIGMDERQIAHIKDVILKFNKRLPLPYVSFSSAEEVSGQEGRHRMYALGEMFGWDAEFPVMVIQDKSSEKTVGELLNESIVEDFELAEKERVNYVNIISRLTHNQPIIQQNGIFKIHNVEENEYQYILALLRQQSWIEYVSATAGKFDFNKISYQGMPKRLYTISGKIKIA